jgi:hypothetical protein
MPWPAWRDNGISRLFQAARVEIDGIAEPWHDGGPIIGKIKT